MAEVLPPHQEILTERLHVRTIRPSDAAAILPILSTKAVMQWTGQDVLNLRQAMPWLKQRSIGSQICNFAVYLRKEHEEHGNNAPLIGIIGTYEPPQIGYLFHPDYHGRGYATECLHALIPVLFKHFTQPRLAYDYLEACTDSENIASQRVLVKAGFEHFQTFSGIFSSPHFLEPRDEVVYRIARSAITLEGLRLSSSAENVEDDDRPVPPIE
ncbi:hypothetical protein LTR62_002754 [Meristemomyces frigidus]|uniref:N-acetyltransferase domain-containing protein n=1 Tax=Meristemomyces frigidus TaxID=1508187 RepID=A0AAN7TKG9_9PEZI|nr:hypothetical protein LTR62_002754 [Meristemomyces frigidus]